MFKGIKHPSSGFARGASSAPLFSFFFLSFSTNVRPASTKSAMDAMVFNCDIDNDDMQKDDYHYYDYYFLEKQRGFFH